MFQEHWLHAWVILQVQEVFENPGTFSHFALYFQMALLNSASLKTSLQKIILVDKLNTPFCIVLGPEGPSQKHRVFPLTTWTACAMCPSWIGGWLEDACHHELSSFFTRVEESINICWISLATGTQLNFSYKVQRQNSSKRHKRLYLGFPTA